MIGKFVATLAACASLGASASELQRDAVERPILLEAGQVRVALDWKAVYDASGWNGTGNYVWLDTSYAAAPVVRVGLGQELEAEVSTRRGLCFLGTNRNGCGTAFQDLGALVRRKLVDGPIEVAAAGGVWWWHDSPFGSGGEPQRRSGLSLHAGAEARYRISGWLALRGQASVDAGLTGRQPQLSQHLPGVLDSNRDVLEIQAELVFGPARWFSVGLRGGYYQVLDPALSAIENKGLPAQLRLQFALPGNIDLGFGLGHDSLAPRLGNADHGFFLSAHTGVGF